MLIAPRLSQRTHKGHPSIETWEETLVGTGSRGDSFEKDIKLGAIHSNASARHVLPSISSDMASLAYNTYISHRSDWNLATTRPTEVLGPVVTEQRSVGSSIYGIRYNPGGTLSVDYEGTEQRHPADDENTPGWDEALARLNAIHSASLRREPSPPPLRIVKRSASNPENQVHPTGRNLRHPTHSDLESISELDMSDSPRDRNIERQRGAALAKLEGRLVASNNRYTTESIYSRSSDGTPFHRPEDGEGRPQWRNLQRHWPD
jgi:hypothetical protein